MLVILKSKKVFCPYRQNPLACASGFSLTPVIPLIISPSNGCNGGWISTSLQISVSNCASKSLILLRGIVKNPFVLQFNACIMLKDCPYGHLDGSPFRFCPYRKFIASRNSFLFSTKLYSSKMTVESQFDAPGSFASLTAQSSAGERNCTIVQL